MNTNKRHAFSLSTHQFRARHVQGVQVKKLSYPACTHLRLVHPLSRAVLFRSVDYHFSSNPHWIVNSPDTLETLTDITVQIWDSEKKRLIIEHFVTLSAMCHRGDKVLKYKANTILIQMYDSIFYYNHGKFPDIGRNVVLEENEIKNPYCSVKSSSFRMSYETKTVLNLFEMYRSVVEARKTCSSLQRHLQQQVCQSRDIDMELHCRIKYLRDRRSKAESALQKETAALSRLKESNEKKSEGRTKLRKRLRELSEELTDELENMDWKIRYVSKINSRLLNLQQSMLHELADIFKISQDPSSHVMMIFGLRILAQDQISEKSEEDELAPALGYTAHLVALLSFILGIPLRFPVTPALSLSTIRDDITAKLDEKRVLPLYIKGKDKSYFSYGVFLLHRNIAQIRHNCGMKTDEIKEPLGNLQSLITSKLQDTMSCQPPARLVSGDKIISKFNTKDPFKKTHKRVRSAPIKLTVSMEGPVCGAGFSSYSNNASVVSSWSSSHSLKIIEGNTTSSTEDMMATVHKDGSDLIVFTEDEETCPYSGDFPTELPQDEPKDEPNETKAHFTFEEKVNADDPDSRATGCSSGSDSPTQQPNGNLDTENLITLDYNTILNVPKISSRTSSPRSSIQSESNSPEALRRTSSSENSLTFSANSSLNPIANFPVSRTSNSPSVNPSSSTRTASRSSFKSYVRGSDLWGMSGSGGGRSASFKSYTSQPSTPTGEEAVRCETSMGEEMTGCYETRRNVTESGLKTGLETVGSEPGTGEGIVRQNTGSTYDVGSFEVVDIEGSCIEEWGEEASSPVCQHVRSSPVLSQTSRTPSRNTSCDVSSDAKNDGKLSKVSTNPDDSKAGQGGSVGPGLPLSAVLSEPCVNANSRSEAVLSRSVSMISGPSLHHYTTKVYMALDTPIIMNSRTNPHQGPTPTLNHKSRADQSKVPPRDGQPSVGDVTPRSHDMPCNSPRKPNHVEVEGNGLRAVIPDECPQEILSD